MTVPDDIHKAEMVMPDKQLSAIHKCDIRQSGAFLESQVYNIGSQVNTCF